jgi:hypothetical protein
MPHPTQAAVSALDFSPDSRLLLCGYFDGSTRLWDLETSLPLGPPVVLRFATIAVAFAKDGRSFWTTSSDGTTRQWQVPEPLTDELEPFALRLAVRTGLTLGDGQTVQPLRVPSWQKLREELQQQQGSGEMPLVRAAVDDVLWHDLRAVDAEQDEDIDGALWHLERLERLKPADWRIRARQVRVLVRAGRLTEASQRAVPVREQAGRDAWEAWSFFEAHECLILQRGPAAEWHLRQILDVRPDSAAAKKWLALVQKALKK